MTNSECLFRTHRDAMDYHTLWDFEGFDSLDAEVVSHPTPTLLYPYYSGHFERVTRIPVHCKSNKLRDVWAALERAHHKCGDYHQFIEDISPVDEAKGTYTVFLGS